MQRSVKNGRPATVTLVAALAALFLAACGGGDPAGEPEPAIVIHDAWARPAPAGDNTAAYLVIDNRGAEDDTLTGATADVADAVEVHLSRMDDGVMKMEHVEDGLTIPAGEAVALGPGGYHLMFIELTRDLQPGDRFDLDLTFARAGTIRVTVEVRQP